MKRHIYWVLVISLALLLVSCGGNNLNGSDADLSSDKETTSSQITGSGNSGDQSETTKSSKALKERAKEEGVSVKEMEAMIKELATKTAETYQTTYEVYLSDLEKEGKTAFDEFATAADFMGITIKEYHEMELSKPALSEEDQATVAAMNSAIADVDVGGDIEAHIDALQLLSIDQIVESMQMDNMFIVEYLSETNLVDLMNHYNDLLVYTEGYTLMDSGSSVTIFGTYRGGFVNVIVSEENNNDMTRVIYTFTGNVDKLEPIEEKEFGSVEGMDFYEWSLFRMEDMIDTGVNSGEGIEYVFYMTVSELDLVIDYYKTVLKDSSGYSESSVGDEIIIEGQVNGERVNASISSDDDVTYVQVNRYFSVVNESREISFTSEDLIVWVVYDLKEIILEEHWSDGGLTLIYTSNAALTDLEDYLRNEFLKYDNYSEYGSVKNNDLTMEAEIEGIVITANPSIDIDTGFTKVMFTCGATK